MELLEFANLVFCEENKLCIDQFNEYYLVSLILKIIVIIQIGSNFYLLFRYCIFRSIFYHLCYDYNHDSMPITINLMRLLMRL